MKFFPFVFLFLSVGCVDFSMDEEAMKKAFKERELVPFSKKLEVGDDHIHYVSINQNRENLAVFIHGSPGSWSAFVDYFKNDSLLKSYDLVSIERPGYGLSDAGRPIISLERQAELIAQVLNEFEHSHVVLVGHSLGGPIAARLAMSYPERVQGLIMVAPSIDPEMERYEWYRTWISTKVGGWITPQDIWVSNAEIVPLKQELEEMVPLWNKVKSKSIVIQGTSDMFVPKENAEFARKMLNDTLLEVRYLEDINHFIPWTHPETIIQALLDLSVK
jgi:pimeloyl-ACP methyl ester carboxylesterase